MNEEAISIYFGLEQGSRADMDVIGRCLIELSKAIKDCSYFLDPSLNLKIEVVRGRDGSLIIDFIVKAVKKIAGDKVTLAELSIVILCLLGTDVRQYFDNIVLDKIFKTDEKSPDLCRKDLEHKLNQIEQNDVGGVHIRNFYGTLYADPNVTGVGASRGHDNYPAVVVKRDQFQRRSSLHSVQQIEKVRVRLEGVRATLVAPVLVSGIRKWKFKTETGEFTAPIIDGDFRERFLAGQTDIRLQAGIEMDIVVSVLENRVNGVWVPKSREIVKVNDIRQSQHQKHFDFRK